MCNVLIPLRLRRIRSGERPLVALAHLRYLESVWLIAACGGQGRCLQVFFASHQGWPFLMKGVDCTVLQILCVNGPFPSPEVFNQMRL
jgi:hypothetical protein